MNEFKKIFFFILVIALFTSCGETVEPYQPDPLLTETVEVKTFTLERLDLSKDFVSDSENQIKITITHTYIILTEHSENLIKEIIMFSLRRSATGDILNAQHKINDYRVDVIKTESSLDTEVRLTGVNRYFKNIEVYRIIF